MKHVKNTKSHFMKKMPFWLGSIYWNGGTPEQVIPWEMLFFDKKCSKCHESCKNTYDILNKNCFTSMVPFAGTPERVLQRVLPTWKWKSPKYHKTCKNTKNWYGLKMKIWGKSLQNTGMKHAKNTNTGHGSETNLFRRSGVPTEWHASESNPFRRSGVPAKGHDSETNSFRRSGVPTEWHASESNPFRRSGVPAKGHGSETNPFRRSGVPVEWHASESNSFRRSGVPVEWQASHSTLFRRSGVPVEGQTSQKQIVPTFRCSKRITSHPSTLFPGPCKYTSRPAHRSARNVEKEPWRVGPFCAIYVKIGWIFPYLIDIVQCCISHGRYWLAGSNCWHLLYLFADDTQTTTTIRLFIKDGSNK